MEKTIFLGTNNTAKKDRYKKILADHNILSPNDLGLVVDIQENIYSLLENSQTKAQAWAKISNLPTLSEDTGFYIDDLNGLPGVSIKRWGGELETELSEDDFLEFFKTKIEHLQDPKCCFETVVSLAYPDGRVFSTSQTFHGRIDKSRLKNNYNSGYPLSGVFIADGRDKTWSEMTDEEMLQADTFLIEKIYDLLKISQISGEELSEYIKKEYGNEVKDWTLGVPIFMQSSIKKYQTALIELRQSLGREPSELELSDALDIDIDAVNYLAKISESI